MVYQNGIWITPEQEYANSTLHKIIFILTTVFSIIGCIIIIGTYFLYKDIRTPSRHIIVCISIADFIVALSNFYIIFTSPEKGIDKVCIIQSFVVTTFSLCSFMWTMALAIFLNLLIVQKKPKLAESFLHPYFHLICWLAPLIINIIALFLHKLGNPLDMASSGWCWISVNTVEKDGLHYIANKSDAVLWMTINSKAIEILTYAVVLVLYIRIKFYLRNKIRDFDELERRSSSFITQKTFQAAKTTDRKLIFIPVIFIILRIWGTIRYFLFISKKQNLDEDELAMQEKVLIICQVIGDNLIGAVNCILFCFLTPKVWNHMKDSLQSMMKCCVNKTRKTVNTDSTEPTEKSNLISEKM